MTTNETPLTERERLEAGAKLRAASIMFVREATSEKLVPDANQRAMRAFFANVAIGVRATLDDLCATAYTTGNRIGYGVRFVNRRAVDECITVSAHEAAHIAFLHPWLGAGREAQLWNVAGDLYINYLLQKYGYKPLNCVDFQWLYPDQEIVDGIENKGWGTLAIYELLKQRRAKQPQSGQKGQSGQGQSYEVDPNDPRGCDDIRKPEGDPKEGEAEARRRAIQAADAASKQAGVMPGELRAIIDQIRKPRLAWRDVLAAFVRNPSRNNWSYRKLSRRGLGVRTVLPSLYSETIGHVLAAVDVSGSMCSTGGKGRAVSDAAMMLCFSELLGISAIAECGMSLVACDAAASAFMTVDAAMDASELIEWSRSVAGGGGTDFAPVWPEAAKNQCEPICAIYLTDGFCGSYGDAPEYPVLWVITPSGNANFKPPFGEVIQMGD